MADFKRTRSYLLKHTNASASSSSELNVLVAYPKDLTGRLIAEALGRDSNFRVAAHVSSAGAVMAFAKHLSIHVALIGASLATHNDGVDIVRRLHSAQSNSRTVILLDTPDPQVTLDAYRAGAKGVFCMSRHGYEVLRECIQCVFEGQTWAKSHNPDVVPRFPRPF